MTVTALSEAEALKEQNARWQQQYNHGASFGCLFGLIIGIIVGAFVMWVSL